MNMESFATRRNDDSHQNPPPYRQSDSSTPTPRIHPDYFLYTDACPISSPTQPATKVNSDAGTRIPTTYIVFFIPGNPGLISYYHTFLSLLVSQLAAAATTTTPPASAASARAADAAPRVNVAGFSLGGFEVESHGAGASAEDARKEEENSNRKEKGDRSGGFYGLDQQIKLTADRIEEVVGRVLDREERTGGPQCKVILVGHSVGAYIALEVLRKHRLLRRRWKQQQQQLGIRRGNRPLVEDLSPAPVRGTDIRMAGEEEKGVPEDGESSSSHLDLDLDQSHNYSYDYNITAAILLTPTIIDIAKSSSGRVLAPLLRFFPAFPLLVSLAAKFIVTVLPTSWLLVLVRCVMGLDTPSDAVQTTIGFLKSRNGVKQSLALAANEMREIGSDQFGAEVWGPAAAAAAAGDGEAGDVVVDRGGDEDGDRPAKLVFYFARRDHWVADQTREAIVESRGVGGDVGERKDEGKGQRPMMIVAEEEDLVHGWCIRQSGMVADKVHDWVREIIDVDQEAQQRLS